MPVIISGRAAREALMPELVKRIKTLVKAPTLAIIQVGNRADSTSFIAAKKSFAAAIGAKEKHIHLPENISEADLVSKVRECNTDSAIDGIIVQLPLPLHINTDAIIESIDPAKDADGLTPVNVRRFMEGREDAVIPATARGIRELLKYHSISLFQKKVTVVGRSMLVGKPIALMCLNENATVTVCHSRTPDLASMTKGADVIIVAAGKPKLITAEHVREGQIVIDVGINTVHGEKMDDEVPGRKLVGDVDFEAVKEITSAISPVPGGVGPMTVLALFENLVDLCHHSVI